MKEIKSAYHGLPGIAVNGMQGKPGKDAQNIMYGNIVDFFDCSTIVIKDHLAMTDKDYTGIIDEKGDHIGTHAGSGFGFDSVDDLVNFAKTDPFISQKLPANFEDSGLFMWDSSYGLYRNTQYAYADNARVCYDADEDIVLKVPQRLRPEIKAGDVLMMSVKDSKIDRMIIVNESLVGCTYRELLNASYYEPFTVKTFDNHPVQVNASTSETLTRCIAQDPLSLNVYEINQALPEKYFSKFNKNFADYIVKQNTDAAVIAAQFDVDNNVKFLAVKAFKQAPSDSFADDGKFGKFDIDSIYDPSSNSVETSLKFTKPALLSNVLLSSATITNTELISTLIPSQLNLDEYGYLKSLTSEDFNPHSMSFEIDKTKFVNDRTQLDNHLIGCTILNRLTDEVKEILDPESNVLELPVDFTDADNREIIRRPVGASTLEYDFIVMFYIVTPDGMKHYALPLNVYANVPEKGEVMYRISSADFLNDTTFKTFDDTIVYDENSDIDITTTTTITAGSNGECLMQLNPNDNVKSIDNIIIDGVDIKINDTYSNSWMSAAVLGKNANSPTIDISTKISNLPDGYDSVADALMSGSTTTRYGMKSSDTIIDIIKGRRVSTAPRVVTVAINYTNKDDSKKRLIKEISQPGFIDPRCFPAVNLTNELDTVSLEKMNDISAGVLTNQVALYTDINIDGFDENGWQMYMDDIAIENTTVDIELTALTEDFTNEIRYSKKLPHEPLIEIAESIDEEIGARLSFDILDTSTTLSGSNMSAIDDLRLTHDSTYKTWIEIAPKNPSVGSLISNKSVDDTTFAGSNRADVSFSKIDDEYIAWIDNKDASKDMMIFFNGKIILHNIPITSLADANPLRLRTLIEFSTPCIAKCSLQYALTKMVIHYNGGESRDASTNFGRDFIIDDNYNSVDKAQGVLFNTKSIGSTTINVPVIKTDLIRFYTLPVSLTACQSKDNLLLDNTNVKIKGSTDNISRTLYINNIGSKPSFASKLLPLRAKNFNDNVENLKYTFIDPFSIVDAVHESSWAKTMRKFSTSSKIEHSSNSSYAKVGLNSSEDNPVFMDFDNFENDNFEECSYLGICYSTSILRNRIRDDKDTFYYNNALIPSEGFSQIERNAPYFVNAGAGAKVRTSADIKSLETWNFEYINMNPDASTRFTGYNQHIADGYLMLDSNVDTGQYDSEGFSLAKVKEVAEKAILDSPENVIIENPEYSSKFPETDLIFRTLLMNMFWEIPALKNGKISPLKIVSAEEGYIEEKVLSDLYSQNIADTTGNNASPVDFVKLFEETILPLHTKSYKKNKIKDDTVLMQHIPYNYAVNVTPKVVFSHELNAPVFMMARRPSIIEETKYEMTKDDLLVVIDEIMTPEAPYSI